jgi:glutamine synthetase
VDRELVLGEVMDVDPSSLSEADRQARGARRLPASLVEALDALAADTILVDALGPALHGGFQAVKRLEAALFAAQDVAFELHNHLYRF